jgi:hypothetical protein
MTQPTPAILRGAEEVRSLYLADQTQPVSYFVETVQTAVAGALDPVEMAATLAAHQRVVGPHGLTRHCTCGIDLGPIAPLWEHQAVALFASIVGEE